MYYNGIYWYVAGFKYRTFLGRFISQIGICSCPAYGADMTSVLKNLDAAVSAAEEYGPNQYAVFDSKLHEQVLRRQAIARYLQTAHGEK